MPLYGSARGEVAAVLGPTNTGKTHLAVERMLGHASGAIGLPLRLLAREIYDRVAKAKGATNVALITGEEKIAPPRPAYVVATVEAMPLEREAEFLAVDEIQLAADPERGHVFTDRLLHARGRSETMFMGAAAMAPVVRRLLPRARILGRERLSQLSYAGACKISRLPRRSAVVAFSADEVYAIAELIRRQKGGAAVVMGSLSPRTRNAQVALYQSGEVDYLVATDAIGMGLNMDVGHVAFAGLAKFDGHRRRPLRADEIGQIAGRAGRFQSDGTFGTTGGCPPMPAEIVEAVETHRFDPVERLMWRNSTLAFDSLPTLLRSLAEPPRSADLKASQDALDERVLRRLAEDPAVTVAAARLHALAKLWEACRTPDFRKTSFEDHVRLVRDIFSHLTAPKGCVPDGWMEEGFARVDRSDGDIDALAARLAHVRTLAYIANQPDWLADPDLWRERARTLEDRLSDALHARLMARFVDQRTSVLLRGLGAGKALLAGVARDGVVTVEGHEVGRLVGLSFTPAAGAGVLERKALRQAAERAVAPEIDRRLGALAAEPDAAFRVDSDGLVLWRGEGAGALASSDPFRPSVRLLTELGSVTVRERAQARLEAFVADEIRRCFAPLIGLARALEGGALRGLTRGLAWRLVEAGGVLDRRAAGADLDALSRAERRSLRRLGVAIGAFCLHLPGQAGSESLSLAKALASAARAPEPRLDGLAGGLALDGLTASVGELEALGACLRAAPRRAGGRWLSDAALAAATLDPSRAARLLRALGYFPGRVRGLQAGRLWRRARAPTTPRQAPPSPFEVLAPLASAHPKRRPRRARRRAHHG